MVGGNVPNPFNKPYVFAYELNGRHRGFSQILRGSDMIRTSGLFLNFRKNLIYYFNSSESLRNAWKLPNLKKTDFLSSEIPKVST